MLLAARSETGRKRGFAFVDLSSEADEQSAIDDLQNVEWMGRAILFVRPNPPLILGSTNKEWTGERSPVHSLFCFDLQARCASGPTSFPHRSLVRVRSGDPLRLGWPVRWKSLVEAAVDPSRDDVNPNKHRNVDLISTLLLKLQLIDDRDGRCAEHEIIPHVETELT